MAYLLAKLGCGVNKYGAAKLSVVITPGCCNATLGSNPGLATHGGPFGLSYILYKKTSIEPPNL